MQRLGVYLLGLLTTFAPFLALGDPHINGAVTAIAGTRFQIAPSGQEGVFTHTVDGVAQVSVIGNCFVHFDTLAVPGQGGAPWTAQGTMRFVFPKDNSTLLLKVSEWVAFEPGTPFGILHCDLEVISGDGQFAGARGQGEIDGVGMFVNQEGTEGTATWTFKGNIFTRPSS